MISIILLYIISGEEVDDKEEDSHADLLDAIWEAGKSEALSSDEMWKSRWRLKVEK